MIKLVGRKVIHRGSKNIQVIQNVEKILLDNQNDFRIRITDGNGFIVYDGVLNFLSDYKIVKEK